MKESNLDNNKFILYNTADGKAVVKLYADNDTVWLSLDQMAELFQRDKSTISRHISNVLDEGELVAEATVAKYATVQIEGGRNVARDITYYSLCALQ